MQSGSIILDYQNQPRWVARHWQLLTIVAAALFLAVWWFAIVLYYATKEPFYGDDNELKNDLMCTVAPLAFIGACAAWGAAVVVLVRRKVAILLLIAAAPLALYAARDALQVRAYYRANRATAAEWQRLAEAEKSK